MKLHTQEDILLTIKEYANEFKPKVEEKTKTTLEDICVEEYSLESAREFYSEEDTDNPNFLACPPNKILLTKPLILKIINYSYQPNPFNIVSTPNNLFFRYVTLHEVYHFALYKINDFFIPRKYENEPIFKAKKIMDEGFACYMALDASSFLYSGLNNRIISGFKRMWFSLIKPGESHYNGYILVKQIVSKHGEEELFKIIKRMGKDNIIQEIREIIGGLK
ncbi:hypothetical protein HYX19_01965 [Candidatus Woesearchaeota archaeon]|nr:hypothetical protein [Candidatus Woesearchaeota archaeon]